jgi:DNA-binding PadR family transcriptional regulator
VETSEFIKNLQRRLVKNFLDLLVLAELRKRPLSGYDVLLFIHSRHHFLVSSGTIYSVLYSLERNGLISGTYTNRKRVYRLTDKGEKTMKTVLSANDKIRNLTLSLLKVEKQTKDQ